MQDLIEKIKRFKIKNILVIGDLILDKYTIGYAERLSPEAPVPIVSGDKITGIVVEGYNAGGAGNTAVNVKTLGSNPYILGIIGEDEEGKILKSEFEAKEINCSGLIYSSQTKTLLKERIIASNQQIVRVDRVDKIKEYQEHYNRLLEKFSELVNLTDIIIISDYAKGTLNLGLISQIISKSKKQRKGIIVDPRPIHTLAYTNATYITPNFKEACEMAKKDFPLNLENAKKLAKILHQKLVSSIILTMAEQGAYFYDSNIDSHFSTFKREVRDVSGAGDTFVATLAVALANKLNLKDAIILANHAAGRKVEKSGVKPVSLDEVIDDIKLHHNL